MPSKPLVCPANGRYSKIMENEHKNIEILVDELIEVADFAAHALMHRICDLVLLKEQG